VTDPLARALTAFALLCFAGATTLAQTSAISYQGRLTDAGNPANGSFDMVFDLYDSPTVGTGTHIGGSVTQSAVAVSSGVFTVSLDFGNPYVSARGRS